MKKGLKFIAKGAAVGAAVYGAGDLVFNLLMNRKAEIPQWFADKVSNADLTELAKLEEDAMAWLNDYGYERCSIVSDRGQKLQGYFLKAKEPSDVYVFCSHGYRSNARHEWCYHVQHYIDMGYNVLMVDHVACGESEGKYISFDHFESKDCIKWLKYLNATYGDDIQIILHGVSLGSATVMMMSGDPNLPSNVKFVVADCGYTSALDEFEYKLSSWKLPSQPIVGIVNSICKKKAGYDIKDTSALESVKNAKVPMLFIHGGADEFVPTYMCSLLYYACASENKDMLIVDGADHAQSYIVDKEAYEAKINSFAEKFITKKTATVK